MKYYEAIEAAREGRLPADFDQWDLRDRDGWTVARTAAINGTLPAGFRQWNLVNGDDEAVRPVAERMGHGAVRRRSRLYNLELTG